MKQLIPWKFLIRQTSRRFGFLDPIELAARLKRFTQPGDVQEPIELIRAGVQFHARGLLNTRAIQHNLDWIWPYWVEQQFNPASVSFVPRGFSFTHINLTHRNWTVVGQPNISVYPIVDPRGLITPGEGGWSLDFWIIDHENSECSLFPSRAEEAKQTLHNGPEVQSLTTSIQTERHAISTCVYVSETQDHASESTQPYLKVEIEARSTVPASLAIGFRPYNPEGVELVDKLEYDAKKNLLRTGKEQVAQLGDTPAKVYMSNYKSGDVLHLIDAGKESHAISCRVGLPTAALLYPLNAGSTTSLPLHIPLRETQPARQTKTKSWRGCLENTTQLRIPHERMQFLFESSCRTLWVLTNEDVYPGPFTYRRFWFRDACLMLDALSHLNARERVGERLASFPERQKNDGYFSSQEGEWDSNGQVIWLLWRIYRLTGRLPDERWKNALKRALKWIERKRLPNDSQKGPPGLMPAGFSAEHLGPNDFYYWDNLWSLAGLRAGAHLLQCWEMVHEATYFESVADSMHAAIERSIERIPHSQTHGAIPAAPYRRMDAGAIGSIVADYPLQIWNTQDARMNKTLEYLLDKSCYKHGFFQDMIHSGINPYLTLQLAQCLLRRGDKRMIHLINSVMNLATSTGSWPEAIHPNTLGGCMGDGHHGWAAADFVMMVRSLFLREENHPKQLCFFSGLHEEWMPIGTEAEFGPAPSAFGMWHLHLKKGEKEAHYKIQCLARPETNTSPILEVAMPGYERQQLDMQEAPGISGTVKRRTEDTP